LHLVLRVRVENDFHRRFTSKILQTILARLHMARRQTEDDVNV